VEDGKAVDWPRVAYGGFQAYGGAIADVGEDETAFSHRETLVEFMGGGTWLDRAEDSLWIASARAFVRAMAPFSSGTYVNAIADEGGADLRRAYKPATLRRLAQLKRCYDPGNVFHLNHNIAPAIDAAHTRPIASTATG
jgi:berberine-like enzyme